MKGGLILAAIAATVSASPVDDVKHLQERSICLPSIVQSCCNGGIFLPFDCLFCDCPAPQATTTTTRSTTFATTIATTTATTPTSTSSTTSAITPVTTPATTSTTSSTTPSTTSSTTTSAAPTQASPDSCAAIGSGSTFGGYQISCSTDFPGGDLSNAPSSSFSGCAAQCDALPGCLGFSYVGGNNAGVCYFKSSQTGASANPGVSSGFRPTPVTPSNSVTTTTRSSTTTAPASTATGSCDAVANNPPAGYSVSCRTDRPGGDLSNAQSSTFAGCVPLCNALAGCIGFAYVGGSNAGNCYFKSALNNAQSNSNVDFAAKNNAGSTTTTSRPSTTTTAAPVFTCLCPAVTF